MTGSAGLRKIDLSDNPMVRDAGAVELARALEDDDWVVELVLRGCSVSDAGHAAMVAMASVSECSFFFFLEPFFHIFRIA